MQVTITQPNVFSEYGISLPVGTTAVVGDNYGASLVYAGKATDTLNVLQASANPPYARSPGGDFFYSASQRDIFERLLSINGALFNGTTDDGPSIQAAINSYRSLYNGQQVMAVFPAGLTSLINSINGSNAQTANAPNGAMLTIPTSVGIDFNGCTLAAGPLGTTASCMLLFTGDAALGANGSYGMSRQRYQNLQLKGLNTYFTTNTIVLDNNTGVDTGPARVNFRNIFFNSCGFGMVGIFSQSYLTRWDDCEFRGWSTTGRGMNFSSGTNQGENHSFNHCAFFNGGTAIRNINSELSFLACSFDYNTAHFDLSANTGCRNDLYGCHLEGFTKQASYSGAQYWVDMGATAGGQFCMYGGQVFVATGSTGNTLAGIFNSGTGAAAAPNGIVLNQVQRTLNAITLNNAGSTGRFLDSQ